MKQISHIIKRNGNQYIRLSDESIKCLDGCPLIEADIKPFGNLTKADIKSLDTDLYTLKGDK